MPQKYYNAADVAKILGVSEDEVKQMLERRELHGYRDADEWKFKAEEIDRMASERAANTLPADDDESGDVLLSDVEFGQSEIAVSGTVIGMDAGGQTAGDSGISLLDTGINLGRDLKPLPAKQVKEDDVDSKVGQFEDLDLTLDEDVALEDSSVGLSGKGAKGNAASEVDLSGKTPEDSDLMLSGSSSGSGVGSDVTIGGDSGISLVDPTDSGLSLEGPPDVSAGGSQIGISLDDSFGGAPGDAGKTGIRKRLKTDEDFLLTPLEEVADSEDSDTGSQVIALDAEGDEAATMVGGPGRSRISGGMDEGMGSRPLIDLGPASQLAASAPGILMAPGTQRPLTEGMPAFSVAADLPETPYTGKQIALLAACLLFLMPCGMIIFDLVRNMWSWDAPYAVNSSLMDLVLKLF